MNCQMALACGIIKKANELKWVLTHLIKKVNTELALAKMNNDRFPANTACSRLQPFTFSILFTQLFLFKPSKCYFRDLLEK